MAPVEIQTIFENSHGAAFEVKIKSPKGDSMQTAARKRLESYGESRFPNLLKNQNRSPPSPLQTPTKMKQGDKMLFTPPKRAEKSRQHNEHIRKAQERVRSDLDKSTTAKRLDLEETQRKAAEKRQETLADRSAKAGKHFEAVVSKTEQWNQKFVEDKNALGQKLEEEQAKKSATHLANLAQRKARAEKHNEAVAGVFQLQKEESERKAKELRSQDSADKFSNLVQKLCNQNAAFGK
eukprot:TRINITY_DN3813_c0_g1_i1.p2 TRINITY_DN3813_c0_g1~~TRINITY_DN3813_c0_g1_i1.p2  ORF type:complete len:237 (+),score=75.38 TRINITY_DN3813_c0_g1_i1:81-791(+)